MECLELECPICFELFSKEIYLCQTGHSLCGVCYKLVVSCPICRQPMSNSIRNRALEALIYERQVYERQIVKQPECPICAMPSPKTKKVLTHLQNHKNKFLTSHRFAYKHSFQKNAEKDFVMVKFHKKLFKFCVEVKHRAEKICFTLQSWDKRDNQDYIFELKYNSSLKGQSTQVVSSLSVDVNGTVFNFINIQKRDFWQMNPLAFYYVDVQCTISKRTGTRTNNIIHNPAGSKPKTLGHV